MDTGSDAQLPSLAPVPAYPRRAVEAYLDDARRAEGHLRLALAEAEARQARAMASIDGAGDSHRLLGQMMVEAQQDLAARRRHAEEAAEALVSRADDEAARILAAARAHVASVLGAEPISSIAAFLPAADVPRERPEDRPDPPRPAPPLPPAASSAAPSSWGHPEERSSAFDAVASVASMTGAVGPQIERATDRPTDRGLEVELRQSGSHLDPSRWRPRWLRNHDGAWPYNEGSSDESYFTRLRDELRAEGTLNSWFETA